jgi:hypothetical protein
VLVVQGGPGTGKTVVALHRAAYLLYSHRFPLEGQGVLVVGPNRLFLSYIEQVLPSLGEAGVEIAVLGGPGAPRRVSGTDRSPIARVKGDQRMVRVIRKAVRDRQRPLRETLRVPYGVQRLSVTPEVSGEIIAQARRRVRTHNAGRRHVEQLLFEALAAGAATATAPTWCVSGPARPAGARGVRADVAGADPRGAAQRPVRLPRPAALGGRRHLRPDEWELLAVSDAADATDVVFTHDDVPLLDEALELLGPRPKHKDVDSVRTYGHIVVDEAQDLSPMELRMLDRRSLNGSMTIVGDIAQATGAWAHDSWDSVLAFLPDRRPPRRPSSPSATGCPGPIMDLAAKVLPMAAPGPHPAESVRHVGDEPRGHRGARPRPGRRGRRDGPARAEGDRVRQRRGHRARVAGRPGRRGARPAGVDHGRATRQGLDRQVTVVPVGLAKGLELDSVIVVEPGRILSDEARGAQALYVALTRSTKRLSIVHSGDLPECSSALNGAALGDADQAVTRMRSVAKCRHRRRGSRPPRPSRCRPARAPSARRSGRAAASAARGSRACPARTRAPRGCG